MVSINKSKDSEVKSKEATDKGDFKRFNLSKSIIEKLKEKNITYLYPIQIATLEHIRAGHDVIAQARTGTGKTVIFLFLIFFLK
jgi:superfamily II DNA/RNA helicase